jgi:hypothetical protein
MELLVNKIISPPSLSPFTAQPITARDFHNEVMLLERRKGNIRMGYQLDSGITQLYDDHWYSGAYESQIASERLRTKLFDTVYLGQHMGERMK